MQLLYLIAGLSIATGVAALNTSNILIVPTTYRYFDNEGVFVKEFNYTADEIELWREQTKNGTVVPSSLAKRSSNDIVYWYQNENICTDAMGDEDCDDVETIIATYTDWNVCNTGGQVGNPYINNACATSWEMYGNWYWMGNCDSSITWNAEPGGTYIGDLYTWNNEYLGPCYATSHSWDDPSCGGSGIYWQFQTLVRCDIP